MTTRALVGLAALWALIAGCTSDVAPTPVASVAFRIPLDSVLVGRTYQAAVVVLDAKGIELTGRNVKYESLVPTTATVDANGLVTALVPGNATLRATVEGHSASATLRVLDKVTRVVITPQSDNVLVGQTRALSVAVNAANGSAIAGRSIRWTSSNPSVATVTAAGVVGAVSKGTVTITAEAELDGTAGTATITVLADQVNSIRMTPSQTPPMRVGATLQVSAAALDINNAVIAGKTFTWTSNNPSVATVSQSGLVTAVAPGSVSILAETDGKTGTLPITVTLVPIGSVTIAPANDTLIMGDVKQYNPVVTDTAGRVVTSLIGRSILWVSSNSPVASVSTPQGVVLASNGLTGTAVINVTIDGVTSNNLNVRVSQVGTIEVAPNPVNVQVGKTVTFTVVLKDTQGNVLNTNRTLNYAVANSAIATVSAGGVVTGVAAGSTQIQVTLTGVSGVSTIVPVTVVP